MAEFRDLSGMGENILNSFNQGRERRREDDARKYYGQAAQGNTDALKSLFGVAPQQAMQLQTQQKTQAKADQEEISTLVWKGASAIKAAPPQVKPQVYAMVREQLAKHSGAQEWLSHLPPQYDPASAAAIDPVIEGIIARAGMYQGNSSRTGEMPAQLQVFDGLMQRAGYSPGTPEYNQAARVFANMDPKARAQIVQDAGGGYQAVEFGGGKGPTAAPVTSGGGMPAPPPRPTPYPQASNENQQIALNALRSNPEFASLPDADLLRVQQSIQDGTPFNIKAGRVVTGESTGLRQPVSQGSQLMGPPKGGDNIPSGYRQGAGGRLEPIPGGPADKSGGGNIDAKAEMQLRKEYADLVKEPLSIINSYKKVQGAGSNPTAAGDLSMIFAYMKMLDPTSVVRETEFANAQNAAGVPDQIQNLYNKVLSGQRLNPTQRADFLAQAKKLADQSQNTVSTYKKRYSQLANEYGFKEARVTFDPNTIEDAEMVLPNFSGDAPKRLKFNPATGKIE